MERENFRLKKNTPRDLLGPIGGRGGTQAPHSKFTVEVQSGRCCHVGGLSSAGRSLPRPAVTLTSAFEKVAHIIIHFNWNVDFLCSSLMLTAAPDDNECST